MSGKLFIERREGEGDYAIRRPGAAESAVTSRPKQKP